MAKNYVKTTPTAAPVRDTKAVKVARRAAVKHASVLRKLADK